MTRRVAVDTADGVVFLGAGEIAELIDPALASDAARASSQALAAGHVVARRVDVSLPTGSFRVLAGSIASLDLLGYKQFHLVRQTVRYSCHLFRLSTGEPLAVMDAAALTRARTAAHAAVFAAHALAGPVPVAMIGSGHEASQGLRALAAARLVSSAVVYSPRKESRQGFAAAMSAQLDLPVQCADTIAEAADGVDLIYAATNSGGRIVLNADDLAPARVVVTIGSTTPRQREVAPAAFHSGRALVVDTLDGFAVSGDLQEGFPAGPPAYACLLGDYLHRDREGATRQSVMYKSVGSVEQDLALAHLIYRSALTRGTTRRLPAIASPTLMH